MSKQALNNTWHTFRIQMLVNIITTLATVKWFCSERCWFYLGLFWKIFFPVDILIWFPMIKLLALVQCSWKVLHSMPIPTPRLPVEKEYDVTIGNDWSRESSRSNECGRWDQDGQAGRSRAQLLPWTHQNYNYSKSNYLWEWRRQNGTYTTRAIKKKAHQNR